MVYPGYQCFKTDRRTVYSSLEQINCHADGSEWLKAAYANFDLRSDQIYGKPYVSMRRPADAIIWPYGSTIRRIWPV